MAGLIRLGGKGLDMRTYRRRKQKHTTLFVHSLKYVDPLDIGRHSSKTQASLMFQDEHINDSHF